MCFVACQISGVRPAEDDDASAETGEGEGEPNDPPPVEGDPPMDPPSDPPADPPDEEDPPVPDLRCVGTDMLDTTDRVVASYADAGECEQAVEAAGEGVVCAWFTPGMPIGPGGWDETGWRPMNIDTGMGLGRRPHMSFDDCLDATRNARGGVVCTNTGVGYKSAHIETNMWCGASSALEYCVIASLAAHDYHVCSFPSEGDGSGAGWVLTEIAGTDCNYLGSQTALSTCNASIP